ncbi:pseudouridine synthase [uncultured Sphingomonas sp.]|uniref:pseudouridine synthase n=1 Tax=uncultured Sphingomonas sp. TaxID=158754 RepID=UPI0035CC0A2B
MSPPRTPTTSDPVVRSDGDQRIAKLLARAGVASRREIERMIAEGRVALNGSVVTTPATILASLDGVTVDDQPVEAPAAARLFLYHKPAGLLVTERDPGGRPTIYDRLPAGLPRVVPVGRLDLGTEGLLLMTTDGGLKRQLELPATGVQRAYRARAYGEVTQQMLEALIEGVEIEGIRYGSIDANLERRTGANVWIEMVLTEGKNREVRRVLDYLGLRVSRLIRTRYGPFVLGDLMPGAVAEVRGHDIASFRKNPTRLDLPQPARQRGAGADPVTATFTPMATGRTPRPVRDDAARGRPVAGRAAPARAPARADRPTNAAGQRRPDERPARSSASRPPRVATRSPREEVSAPQPARDAQPPTIRRANSAAAGPAGGRGGARSARSQRADAAPASVAKPARAARARQFRETREPAEHPRPTRPASPGRPAPSRPVPSGSRPAKPPRGAPPRPPRTRS